MSEKYIESIDEIFDCYFKEKGCFKIPIRMIGVLTGEISESGMPCVDAVMLCRDHSVVYRPKGKVVIDEFIANDKTISALAKMGI